MPKYADFSHIDRCATKDRCATNFWAIIPQMWSDSKSNMLIHVSLMKTSENFSLCHNYANYLHMSLIFLYRPSFFIGLQASIGQQFSDMFQAFHKVCCMPNIVELQWGKGCELCQYVQAVWLKIAKTVILRVMKIFFSETVVRFAIRTPNYPIYMVLKRF